MRSLALLLSALALMGAGANWRTFHARGITVRYPPGWFATATRLTPVTAPPQIIAVASYRLPPDSGGANGCQPKAAIDRLPPTGAFIFGWEYGSDVFRPAFPPRPKHFSLKNYASYECMGLSYMLRFRQAGRFFQIHVVLGKRASTAQRAAVLRILDSFSAKPT
ncbi:MAG TPA: hypothetical protein VFU10_05745 [Gaiellaceae bacterium]|nr:hypothetical protein [Gaiellaceae bacterium]